MAYREREVKCDVNGCEWAAKTMEIYNLDQPETTPRVIHGTRDEKGLLRDSAGQPMGIISQHRGMGDHTVVFEGPPPVRP